MAVLDPALVTPAPSAQYGFYVPTHRRYGTQGPVVQVAQFAEGYGWIGTQAQNYARQITALAAGQMSWVIDAGQGLVLDAHDTAALCEYAQLMLALDLALSQ